MPFAVLLRPRLVAMLRLRTERQKQQRKNLLLDALFTSKNEEKTSGTARFVTGYCFSREVDRQNDDGLYHCEHASTEHANYPAQWLTY